jgi:hypothetical protein
LPIRIARRHIVSGLFAVDTEGYRPADHPRHFLPPHIGRSAIRSKSAAGNNQQIVERFDRSHDILRCQMIQCQACHPRRFGAAQERGFALGGGARAVEELLDDPTCMIAVSGKKLSTRSWAAVSSAACSGHLQRLTLADVATGS